MTECSLSMTWTDFFCNLILLIPISIVSYVVLLVLFQCIYDGKFDIQNQKRLFQYVWKKHKN